MSAAWNAPGVTMRARQQLLRTLITDIVVDVDDEARDVILTIHWRGGQHSELRVRKPRAGEHGCATAEDALAVMRSMAGRWSDEHIAASLNRMGLPTGQGKTWTAHRVSSVRRVRRIHAYRSAEKDGEWLIMSEAAKALGVTNHLIRRLITDWRSACRAGRGWCALPNSRRRHCLADDQGGSWPKRSPVSH